MINKPIKLSGVSAQDVVLLEQMWGIESLEDFISWTLTLPIKDMERVKYLTARVVEALDIEAEGEVNDVSDASDVLKKFTL